jgi:hypothetical protein
LAIGRRRHACEWETIFVERPDALTPEGRTGFGFEIFGAPEHAQKLEAQTRLFRGGEKVSKVL